MHLRKFFVLLFFSGIAFSAQAEIVSVPIFASYDLLRELMLRELFKNPDHSATVNADKLGCTTVNFAKPQVNGIEGLLQLRANVEVKLGLPNSAKKCTVLSEWSGSTALKGTPVVVGKDALAVQFKVVDAQVFDTAGMPMKSGLIKQALQTRLRPFLEQYQLDLQPSLARAKTVLPLLTEHSAAESLARSLASVHLGTLQAEASGLKINVDMEALNPAVAQTLVRNNPASALPETAQEWDSVLSSIVKQLTHKTKSPEIREALLEVLQDARQQLKKTTTDRDALKSIFMASWDRLAPLAKTIGAKAPQQDLLQLLAYLSGADLFKTLEALEKVLGVDLSAQGLTKLMQTLDK